VLLWRGCEFDPNSWPLSQKPFMEGRKRESFFPVAGLGGDTTALNPSPKKPNAYGCLTQLLDGLARVAMKISRQSAIPTCFLQFSYHPWCRISLIRSSYSAFQKLHLQTWRAELGLAATLAFQVATSRDPRSWSSPRCQFPAAPVRASRRGLDCWCRWRGEVAPGWSIAAIRSPSRSVQPCLLRSPGHPG
jgi:hypothetical protein